MSQSRRPSITIYNYPQHLNPFNEDLQSSQPPINHDEKTKETKHKFWTFGRSRKKRSNSFSIKSTWNGLFGKRKEAPEVPEKRSTITTVSTTYKTEPYDKPMPMPRSSKDQQEFDEALGTLARRRKYTLDNSSRYSSSLTVNGDLARIYHGSPQDTTTSIMGDLTPKPPARRFGQVSPKPTDEIPPLNFDDKEPKENGTVTLREKPQERTPVPPLRRFGNRSSQRLNASTVDPEEEANRTIDVSLHDENENVPEDYVFKRFSHDAVRKSNLSINSCVSVGSTTSAYRRKKRRAPQPPRRKEQLETPEENVAQSVPEAGNIELHILEPIDMARVAENIDGMMMKSIESNEAQGDEKESPAKKLDDAISVEDTEVICSPVENGEDASRPDEQAVENKPEETKETPMHPPKEIDFEERLNITLETVPNKETEESEQDDEKESLKKEEEDVTIEYRRTSQESLEIMKDIDDEEEVCLRKKGSTGTLSRSDSFSVKEEIEKIERQIKALETRNSSRDSSDDNSVEDTSTNSARQSIQANRKHFFQDMVDSEDSKNALKIEFREFPREQNDIHVIRLTDPPVPVIAPREPVKVIELHISEPIKQKPEILDAVNPIPKPRRQNSLNLNESRSNTTSREDRRSLDSSDKRGKSF